MMSNVARVFAFVAAVVAANNGTNLTNGTTDQPQDPVICANGTDIFDNAVVKGKVDIAMKVDCGTANNTCQFKCSTNCQRHLSNIFVFGQCGCLYKDVAALHNSADCYTCVTKIRGVMTKYYQYRFQSESSTNTPWPSAATRRTESASRRLAAVDMTLRAEYSVNLKYLNRTRGTMVMTRSSHFTTDEASKFASNYFGGLSASDKAAFKTETLADIADITPLPSKFSFHYRECSSSTWNILNLKTLCHEADGTTKKSTTLCTDYFAALIKVEAEKAKNTQSSSSAMTTSGFGVLIMSVISVTMF